MVADRPRLDFSNRKVSADHHSSIPIPKTVRPALMHKGIWVWSSWRMPSDFVTLNLSCKTEEALKCCKQPWRPVLLRLDPLYVPKAGVKLTCNLPLRLCPSHLSRSLCV